MKNKLLLAFLLATTSCHVPLMASASDDPTALHADDYALTARRLCQEGARAQEAAEAFSQYFTARPLGVGDTTPSESELAFYTLALQTYAQLNTAQKVTHQTPYTHLMRWFLWRQPNSAQRLLSMVKDLFLFDQDEEITLARTLVMGHPDRARAFLDVPLGAAIIYEILNRTEEAALYYSIALKNSRDEFTTDLFRAAVFAFGTLQQRQNGLSAYKMMFQDVPEEQLIAADYLNAAGCFLAQGYYKEADSYLMRYYEKEHGAPNPLAYRLSAASATNRRDFETACEYWTLALHGNVKMHFSDHANAAACFTHTSNHERAAHHWKKALTTPDFQPSYKVYYDACKAFSTVKDHKSALPAADGFMSLRAGEAQADLVTGDLLLAAKTYSHNQDLDKSTPLWDQILKAKPSVPVTYAWAGVDYYHAGQYLRASNAFLCVSPSDLTTIHKRPWLTEIIVLSHVLADRKDVAQDILTKPGPSAHKKTKKAKASRRASAPMSEAQVDELKKSIARTCMTHMHHTLSHMAPTSHDELNRLQETLQEYVHRATQLFDHVCAGTLPEAPGSGVASSSSSPSASSNPFLEIQRLAKNTEELARVYKTKKTAFDRVDAKARHKEMIAQAAKEEAHIFTPLQSYATPNAPLKKPARSKTKRTGHGGASSSGPSRPYGPDTRAAPPIQLPQVSNVEWRITPTAESHMKKLKTVRGFQAKFDAFRHEIELEPWGRRGQAATHASGRAKRLKGYENVFSRRFAKGERFFYRVEYAANGRVIVTILGLMEHDL